MTSRYVKALSMRAPHTNFRRRISIGLALGAVLFASTPLAAQTVPYSTPVHLGKAANYAILSKAGISSTGITAITGNMGVSPIASTAITGFSLRLDPTGTFSKSSRVTGRVFAASYAAPTPTNLTTAIGNMQTAYNNAAGRLNPRAIELGGGNIGGRTLPHGLYKWSSGVNIPTDVTLNGTSGAVWIFQIAGTLNIGAGKKVLLTGGALSKNVFWQVAGQTTLQTTAVMHGNILGKTAIVMRTGAKLYGRALSQTAVTLDATTVTRPAY